MEAILSIIFFAVIGFLIYLFMPINTKKTRIIYFSILLVILLAILVIPNDFICNIPILFLGKSINQIISDFCQKSDHLQNLISFTPTVKISLTLLVQNVAQGLIVCVILSLCTFFTSITFLIINIVKKNKIVFSIISTIICIIISVSLMFIPVCTVSTLYIDLNENTAKKSEKLYQTYANFDDYMPIFNILDNMSDGVGKLGISSTFNFIGNAFNFYSSQKISNDLRKIDSLLNQLKTSGITIIYTDPSFHFNQTKKTTFNFKELKSLILNNLNTNIYYDISRSYTNKILRYFEQKIQQDKGISEINLQLTQKEFVEQYPEIIDLLKFVVDNNLVNKLNDFNIGSVFSIIGTLGISGLNTIATLSKYKIVIKIQEYLNFSTTQEAGIYTCMILYKCLDAWLDDYRLSEMHDTSMLFLEARDII